MNTNAALLLLSSLGVLPVLGEKVSVHGDPASSAFGMQDMVVLVTFKDAP